MQDELTEDYINDARMSVLEDDILAYEFMTKWNSHESGLFQTKWFDYRQISPAQATILFARAFRKVYREQYATAIDRSRAPHVQTLHFTTLRKGFESRKTRMAVVGCWRARQVADALGIPYETYVTLAMEWRLRFWKQPYLPQPQHLYSEQALDDIQTRWQELQASDLYKSELPAFRNENFSGIPYQSDHHAWLWDQAWLRSDPAYWLAKFVSEEWLPREFVERRTSDKSLFPDDDFIRRVDSFLT